MQHVKVNISLTGLIKLKLQQEGEKIDDSRKFNYIYVAHSCILLDEGIIKEELNHYISYNNINQFELEDRDNLVEHILNNHILNVDSKHSLENKDHVFRKVIKGAL